MARPYWNQEEDRKFLEFQEKWIGKWGRQYDEKDKESKERWQVEMEMEYKKRLLDRIWEWLCYHI